MVPEMFERDHQEYLQQIAKRRIFFAIKKSLDIFNSSVITEK